jgi:hypothetical protein
VQGQIVFVALRDIAAGEELTHDWATTDDDDYTLECRCGSVACRGGIRGKDWKKISCRSNTRVDSLGIYRRRSRRRPGGRAFEGCFPEHQLPHGRGSVTESVSRGIGGGLAESAARDGWRVCGVGGAGWVESLRSRRRAVREG